MIHTRRGDRGGYVMLVALILMAVIAVVGATSLSVAGVDQRIAIHNRKHMMVMNTASAGNDHARWQLQHEPPANEGLDTGPDTFGPYVKATEAEASFGGLSYAHNLGVYWVEASYLRCGNPPPGTPPSWARTSSGATTGRWSRPPGCRTPATRTSTRPRPPPPASSAR